MIILIMKKFLFILFFPIFLYGQEAESLKVHDTRLIENLPSDFKRIVKFDFKHKNVANQVEIIDAGYSAILTTSPWIDDSGGPISQLALNKNGMFLRQGYCGNNGNGIIYDNKNKWESWNKIIIGDSKGVIQKGLEVNGTIRSKEVKIEASGWSDFVFNKDYKLPSLSEVENHIKEKGTLSDIPSEKEVMQSGINLGEMQAKLLQKIEELTLYVIELKKENEAQNILIKQLQDVNHK